MIVLFLASGGDEAGWKADCEAGSEAAAMNFE
jgi:hypothetical protein